MQTYIQVSGFLRVSLELPKQKGLKLETTFIFPFRLSFVHYVSEVRILVSLNTYSKSSLKV